LTGFIAKANGIGKKSLQLFMIDVCFRNGESEKQWETIGSSHWPNAEGILIDEFVFTRIGLRR